jgi:hypothetical protein
MYVEDDCIDPENFYCFCEGSVKIWWREFVKNYFFMLCTFSSETNAIDVLR